MVTTGISRIFNVLTILLMFIFVGCAGNYEDEDVDLTPTKDEEAIADKGESTDSESSGEDEDFKDEASLTDSDEEGDLTAEEIPEEEELTEEEECTVGNCEDEDNTLVANETPTNTEPAIDSWTPNNDGPAPTPVKQADLRIDCTQLGAGLEPGYLRFGCKAFKQNGRHYGIVKGWWSINRGDGNKAKSKSLNFREAGYDMAFDVLESDAAAGISVAPGTPPPSI
jgi:hypothetical protein